MKFIIGSNEIGKKFSVDASILADTRALVTASSGAGKSWLLRVFVESVSTNIQTIIIDPEGEFATLREKLDILVVGENGDLQVSIDSAGLLARKLAETGISAVIDIYELAGKGDPWDKRRQFVANFLHSLMNLPKSMRHPMLIIVDEAHQFAPEAKGSEFSTASRSAINSLMSAGRKRGFGGILATQRISKIHKDSIADARNVFIGGTTLDIDQERAGDMLGFKRNQYTSLRDLSPGEFYCFGPAFGDREVHRFCSAQVKTTHPKAGQRDSIAVPKASAHISKIASQFGDIPTLAKEERDSMDALKSENVRLKHELSVRPVQIQPRKEIEIKTVEVPIFKDGQIEELKTVKIGLEEDINKFSEIAMNIVNSITMASKIPQRNLLENKGFETKLWNHPTVPVKVIRIDKGGKDYSAKALVSNDDISVISGPEQRILDAIAWFESIGNYQPKQVAVSFLAGYTYGGGAFNNPRGSLRTKGLVEYRGDCISLTDAGRQVATQVTVPLSVALLQAHVLDILPGPEKNILSFLLDLYPNETSKEALSEMVGKRGGAFNNPLGRLRSLGLIEYPRPSYVVALPFLFME